MTIALTSAFSWLEPIPGSGFDAVRDAYLEVLDGKVAPDVPTSS